MSDPIPITRPTLGPEEQSAVAETLASGWVGQGPRTATFEKELARLTGAPHAVATASGTAALHLALLALGLGPGDEVIVPASSFIATANAVRMVGATPVFADVALGACNLDPADAAARITPRTRALLVVHQLGHPADLDACGDLAARHGLALVEDAACALGSRYRGTPVGRPHGALACFSFHPRKVITTGEGGAVTTADPALDARLRQLRNHGAEASGAEASGAEAHLPGAVRFTALGYNYRMSDLQAAVGLAQLARLDALVARRRALAARYAARLGGHPARRGGHPARRGGHPARRGGHPARRGGHPAWSLPQAPPATEPNWQSYQLLLAEDHAPPVADVARALQAAGVASRPGLTALHREPLYHHPHAPALPNAERIAAWGLQIPLFPDLTDAQADRVCDALLAAVG
jgi:perosamine synthetase